MKTLQVVTVPLIIWVSCLFFFLIISNNTREKNVSKPLIKDSIYTINNMKYIIINGNVINLTKDSLECKFYKDEENF